MSREVVPMLGNLLAVPQHVLEPFLRLRALVPADVEQLGQLMMLAFSGGVDDAGETSEEHRAEADKTMAGGYGPLIPAASLVAERDHVMVGAVVVVEWRRRPLLAFLLVLPEHRGRGVGTALISASAAQLRALEHREWTLAVTRGNPAVALYERLGFREHQALRDD